MMLNLRAQTIRLLLLAVLVPAAAQAQLQPERLPPLSDFLGESALFSVMPSFWISPETRSALDTRLFWPGRQDHRYTLQLGIELGGAIFDPHSYARAGIDARVLRSAKFWEPWLGVNAIAGMGTGPSSVLQFSTGVNAGPLGLAVRSSWLEGDRSTRPDSLPLHVPYVANLRYTDAELSATHKLGPFLGGITAGSRFGTYDGLRTWAFATLTLPVRDHLGITFASGWRPAQPERAQPGGGFVQVAMRFDVSTRNPANTHMPAPIASPVDDELTLAAWSRGTGYTLRLVARNAQKVELKGDLTDWDVHTLQRTPAGIWELDVDRGAGVYKLNIRIDGEKWIVPAGMVSVPDGFGGFAGVLTLN